MINSNLIDDFLDYMKATKGSSDNTIREYYYDLRIFVRFIKRRKNLAEGIENFDDIPVEDITPEILESVTKQDIYAYNAFLERERKISNRSKFRKISSVRSFYNYLYSKIEVIKKNPIIDIDMPKIEKTLPVYLTLDESLNLLKTIEKSKMKLVYKKRDYAIVTLFLNCGMRLSELSGINISHLKEDNTLKVIGKGNKERTIYLNEASVYAIQEYLKLRPQIEDDALFLSMREQRMSNRSIQHMIEKHMKNSGLDTNKYSVHKLRHTAATLLYEYGNADIRSLQEILGHESVNTTEIYTHVNKKSLKKMVESNPLANIKDENNK
ncbi:MULTISPECIES: tyrosine recombinase XerC [Peptoniphilus]|uniref:tyrosine recombinase XerC n=1 Tax=Peptoniphilus TaxID=162289 RepID=UPI000289AB58|nr:MULTISPECIES: tyrosine recombinase XerC [Peptoniphilus]MDU1043501.1 tyrosine recombinase XerC [Peptoniphilus rhinitidis]MDU2115575.1 tyrosine recombinase XerC [Peptoniphilus lacydonensis]MDU3751621.1 tyrosine recombinase XerC [Peptoniphilus rhinitidis]MDU5595520.1 tyrosine recombinase XerC [Peptoniphilus rhinitidis]MDU7301743.1 tyrosine recombinase XerC [Peptoniphilus lacydonensis]